MLTSITLDQVIAIADAAAAANRDLRAMDRYLHPDKSEDQFRTVSPLDLANDAAAGAFDSHETDYLRELIEALSNPAQDELLALMYLGREGTNDFAAALAYARRVRHDGIVGYLAGKPLHIYLAVALKNPSLR